MAQKKKTAATADKNKKTVKKAESAKKPAPAETKKRLSPEEEAAKPQNRIIPYIFGVLAIFDIICHILIDFTSLEDPMGVVGRGYLDFMYGLFGLGAYLVPAVFIYFAIFWRRNVLEYACRAKVIAASAFLLLASALVAVCFIGRGAMPHTFNVIELFKLGMTKTGGGAIGGFFGALSYGGFKFVGSLIVLSALLIVLLFFLVALTPKDVWLFIRYKIKVHKREREERRAAVNEIRAKRRPELIVDDSAYDNSPLPKPEQKKKKKKDVDVPIDDGEIGEYEGNEFEDNPTDPDAFDLAMEDEARSVIGEGDVLTPVASSKLSDGELDLSKIFVDPEKKGAANTKEGQPDSAETEITVEKRTITETPIDKNDGAKEDEKEKAEPPKPAYVFPPIELLAADSSHLNAAAAEAELRANAEKLVDTLASFNVKTKIVNVSRGPTITRYELLPEAGTRVKAIANLVDDISLSLATSGVRIEAPIPGKAAVGVEVPNKTVATVYVRSLIENEKFKSNPSKLNACLGADVAGTPIFCDIAKMPHMLIAGATGMGKSVCINSIIISLLYKATPDEVKFILVDPKKVEFNLYNGIPHLLVPVVSDPKKAAGALHWAVTEMERRFELIESVGVRDIKNYNAVTRDDPEREFLPQIVIIIDELADLMMTAPDEVEDSICRLAQKARAAGMHLIIGTQRPSVDVITGLIKANIPSRIACKVASQTDSRVIFDMAGAEKLIGRGDMLYAPVGAMKPIRVQGAFVSDAEVESIADFIKNSAGNAEYSREVIERIEKEAAACGNKKGAAASMDDGDGEADPMLRPAIELAIESGKISTSLIQRRLSLGYGRAAKLIDRMQELGFVSAPEGQKPREVLITRQQYMEMVVKDEDAIE